MLLTPFWCLAFTFMVGCYRGVLYHKVYKLQLITELHSHMFDDFKSLNSTKINAHFYIK